MSELHKRAWQGTAGMILGMAAILFVVPWTLAWWQAWLFLAVWLACSVAVTLDLMVRDPALLERRIGAGPGAETEPRQKIIMALLTPCFAGLLLLPALDRRFGWSEMSPGIVGLGDALVVVGWLIIHIVFRANSFTAATISLSPEQHVISTGPYALVRHPMYFGALPMLAGVPLALGSWWGLLVFAAMVPGLVWRIVEEEKFLVANLAGYADYREKVRYRLVPGFW
ncbi:MAG: isoprenylcysteine carboxylmethyltransferase family protein [Alphaproteobacteria bacterium]|nr:isoprenylcysteine carboxylmethyltransferase family protein [Alphaproteobacteria bacterium]